MYWSSDGVVTFGLPDRALDTTDVVSGKRFRVPLEAFNAGGTFSSLVIYVFVSKSQIMDEPQWQFNQSLVILVILWLDCKRQH